MLVSGSASRVGGGRLDLWARKLKGLRLHALRTQPYLEVVEPVVVHIRNYCQCDCYSYYDDYY